MEMSSNALGVIEERRLKWFGHIKAMSNSRIPSRKLTLDAEGKMRVQ